MATATKTSKPLTAIEAYTAKKAIDKQIAELTKQSKDLRSVIEGSFRSNQIQVTVGKFQLVRSLVSVVPTEVPKPYSFYKYELRSL
jgi:hypothetical protein